MRRNSQLSSVLHVLLHMAEAHEPMTSEMLAQAMRTNPVVVRRTLAGLRDHGYVRSGKGHGGGWTLACDLSAVTLRDVYAALGDPPVLAIANRTEAPGCVIEQAVNAALSDVMDEAEALLLSRFGEVTLASLGSSVRGRLRVGEAPARLGSSVGEAPARLGSSVREAPAGLGSSVRHRPAAHADCPSPENRGANEDRDPTGEP